MSPTGLLPLTETTFLILLSLSPGPRHGYAIMKDVESLSEGRVLLSTGTLYGALKRLLDDGLIQRMADPQPNPTDRERKDYILTQHGRQVLNAEAARMRTLVALVPAQGREGNL
jgi:DNA-binding PadR family transcriptional regulator